MYKLIRAILFRFNTETVHYFSMNCLGLVCKNKWFRAFLSKQFCFNHQNLETNAFGLTFKNPVGLGAGFDKNALYLTELATLGFGFVEIGTVTPIAQPGNEKPRLFRLPIDKALINRMGFNNEGVVIVAERLKQWRMFEQSTLKSNLIIGGNIGKNKITANEDAWKDYELCFRALFDVVDYFVVNVSSPNTPGLRALQDKDELKKILVNLQNINQLKTKQKPILLKIAPDLTNEQLDDIIELSLEINLSGLVACNTTISRDNLVTSQEEVKLIGAGGLSGLPIKNRSTEVVSYLANKLEGKVPILASGGIFNGIDAKEKLKAGATLIQVWTGFVYEGPKIAKAICKWLVKD